MARISDQIKAAILSADISRFQISRETGIEESALSRFVNGKRGLSMGALDLLAEYFGYQLVKSRGK